MKSAIVFRRYLDSLLLMIPPGEKARAVAEQARAEHLESLLLIAGSAHSQSMRSELLHAANDSLVAQLQALSLTEHPDR